MSACADKQLLVQGLADGELDAAHALAAETHLTQCEDCSAEYARIVALRQVLAAEPLNYPAPPGTRRAIAALLASADEATESAPASGTEPVSPGKVVPLLPTAQRVAPRGLGRHLLNWRWASGALSGLAAGVLLMVAVPHEQPAAPDSDDRELVAGQVRSLMASHLTDVAASDKHVVKPWFNGRIDFAPPVPDLTPDGFALAGGRLDVIAGKEVAALVYRRRLHVINVFVAPTPSSAISASGDSTREGYNILRWTIGDLQFRAVSDLNAKELGQFRQLFIARSKG